jgi:hypothetical protein
VRAAAEPRGGAPGMATDQIATAPPPRATCVMVILTAVAGAERCATIELWPLGGDGPGPRRAPDVDLTSVLKEASEVSGNFGFHGTYEFHAEPDEIASYVLTWPERRDAIAEIRVQRRQLETETGVGRHRADGTRKTDTDRANAVAMAARLGVLRDALMKRGFGPQPV